METMTFGQVLMLTVVVLGVCSNFGVAGDDTGDQCTPKQTHLSYGDTTTEIVVMWSTEGQCSPALVSYGEDQWSQSHSAPGESRLFDDPSNTDGLQVLHVVKLRDLEADKTYFYKPTSAEYSAGPYFFRIPADNTELNMMVISDVNATSPSIHAITQEASTGKYAAILHTGNIAMNLSTGNGAQGDSYMTKMEPAMRYVQYMTSPGPDEVEDGTYSHYMHRFSMPQAGWPMSHDKLWYSIDIGLVHLISYSTEVFYAEDGSFSKYQHEWLVKDLKQANTNRESVPWIIAFGHRPMYCSYEDPAHICNQKKSKVKSELEDIFFYYGVDIIIQSYGGAYERSYPMYKGITVNDNYTNPAGPVHIVNGAATAWDNEYNFTMPIPGWSAFRLTDVPVLTYGRFRIINASLAEYEQISTSNGSVMDSFKITQEKHGPFSTEELPANITAQIDKEIVDAGGKPGVINIEEVDESDIKTRLKKLLEGDNRTRLIIGVSCGAFILVSIIVILFVRNMRKRRRNVLRRWEQMDINYGKKFYSKAPDKDEDHDFEIDMSDGTEPTRKLLNADD